MPSGAKKRKAAKKKLGKETKNNGSQGSNDPKSQDVERAENVEGGGVKNYDEGVKEATLEEGNVAEEVKQQEEDFENVTVHTDDASREFQNFNDKSSSSSSSGSSSRSSSSSSSGDDELVVEKETPTTPEETESGRVDPQEEVFATPCAEVEVPAEFVEELVENSVDESVEESIPIEESVKQVVSLPKEPLIVSESVPADDSSTSDVIESGLKQNVDEVLQPFDEKTEVASEVVDLLQEKIEEEVISGVHGGSEDTSEHVGGTVRDDEVLLPQSSSGIKNAAEGFCMSDDVKVPETQKYAEEQPLLSSAPMPVRRTSVFNCCGLFEVFSGGSS